MPFYKNIPGSAIREMSETSAYFGVKPEQIKLKTVDFVQLKGYFVTDLEVPGKGRLVYACIDEKLLKFYLDAKSGKLKYSSQIVIKSAKGGYSDAEHFDEKLYLVLNPSFNANKHVISATPFNLQKSPEEAKDYLSNSEKFYVLVWNLRTKKPEFKIRFRQQILRMAIRPSLVVFALANRVSIFERASLTHLLKVPIRLPEGELTRQARNGQKSRTHPVVVRHGGGRPGHGLPAPKQSLFALSAAGSVP